MSLKERHIGRKVAGVGVGVALMVLGLQAPASAAVTITALSPTSGPTHCVVAVTGTGFKASDIAAFFHKAKIPAPQVVSIGVDGGKNMPGFSDADGEVELYSSGGPGLRQWRRRPDGMWAANEVTNADGTGPLLAWADIDCDGVFELIGRPRPLQVRAHFDVDHEALADRPFLRQGAVITEEDHLVQTNSVCHHRPPFSLLFHS